MSSTSFPFTIRNARDDEYETLGRLHIAALLADPMMQLFWSQVDPDALLQWAWIDGAKAAVAKGNAVVDVIERTDTKEVMGVTWYEVYSRDNLPKPVEHFPPGFGVAAFQTVEAPRLEWFQGLTERYGKYLCLAEFAIAPSYQSQGFGKALLLHVITHAKEQGLNIALAAVTGKPSYYAKFGFKEVAGPIMLTGGTVEGTNLMILELFPSSSGKE